MEEAAPEPPKLVRIFELIGIGSVVLAVIVSGIDDWFDAVFYLGQLALILLITRGGLGWARWAMLVFFGAAMLLIGYDLIWQRDAYSELLAVAHPLEIAALGILNVLVLVQFYLLLTTDVREWIAAKSQDRQALSR